MNLFWKTAKFQRLDAVWKKKLRQSGFVDIEDESSSSFARPIARQLVDTQNASTRDHEAIFTYYTRAEQFLSAFDFPTKKHRRIWELHAQGVSVRRISHRLRVERNTVYHFICKYRRIAGLEKWKK
jgi:DNA-binding NarL/FixJ family response regulator